MILLSQSSAIDTTTQIENDPSFSRWIQTEIQAHVSKALYDANKKSDRDKDLIACER